jgi:hypothetical protein
MPLIKFRYQLQHGASRRAHTLARDFARQQGQRPRVPAHGLDQSLNLQSGNSVDTGAFRVPALAGSFSFVVCQVRTEIPG